MMARAIAIPLVIALASSGMVGPQVAEAATIRLLNRDDPGEGFNDPTPAAPVGGNPGTTVGEQRLHAFQYAIDIWAAELQSRVEIRVSATFDNLACDAGSAILGTAGPVSAFADFAGAPRAHVLYPSALADRLAGIDLAPDEDDIEAQFNSRFGSGCAFPAKWYYGLDGQAPANDSDLVTVVLHELGHGLGFLSLVDVFTGARANGDLDDAFTLLLVDDRSDTTLDQMTNAQRRSAIRATGHLKWEGAEVVAASSRLRAGADAMGRVEMYAPSPPVTGSSVSHWSDTVSPDELMEPYFTRPNHALGLTVPALEDIGWTPVVACGAADCDGDGQVTIAELTLAVRIALGEESAVVCPAADLDGDGMVGVHELIAAVNSALNRCAS